MSSFCPRCGTDLVPMLRQSGVTEEPPVGSPLGCPGCLVLLAWTGLPFLELVEMESVPLRIRVAHERWAEPLYEARRREVIARQMGEAHG